MRTIKVPGVLMLVAVSLVGGVHARAADGALSGEDRAFCDWYDALRLPSTAGCPLVQIRTEEIGDSRTGRLLPPIGYLILERPNSFTMLGLDLWVRVVGRTEGVNRLDAERLDLRSYATRVAEHLSSTRSGGFGSRRDGAPSEWPVVGRLSEVGCALALARHCALNGETAAAHRLFESVRRSPSGTIVGSTHDNVLIAEARAAMAIPLIWQMLLAFESAPWQDLLERLQAYRSCMGEWGQSSTCEDLIQSVRLAIGASAARGPRRLDVDRDSKHAVIESLIMDLQDQQGGQFSAPGLPSVFVSEDGRVTEGSPAKRILDIGAYAIPQLIDGLSDARPTRVIGYWRPFTYSHYVLRVGDACREILERMTERAFFLPPGGRATMFPEPGPIALQSHYRTWWTESSALLPALRGIAFADTEVRRLQLIRRMGHCAPGPVVGSPAPAVWGTGSVVASIPELPLDRWLSILHSLTEESPQISVRILAAWAARDHGDLRGIESVIRMWRNLGKSTTRDDLCGIVSFLASCGDKNAVRALFQDLDARPARERAAVVRAFGRGGFGAVRGFSADHGVGIVEPWLVAVEIGSAIEEGLARRLGDHCASLEAGGGEIGDSVPPELGGLVPAIRIADDACCVLALRWPGVYTMARDPVRRLADWDAIGVRFQSVWGGRCAKESGR
jgi:hypothetical protein